ncbi:hypothetical protein F5Y10DRAFT_259134 [Nemania abortiva]|nr:hypothetical protein F5Y10DRAFT_259134 [Nemania abortiva]
MDDPWGSPWASTDAPSDNDPSSSSRANIFLSPPPKAFFSNAAGLSAQSPWSDHDDGFGVRKTGDRADGTDSQNEWSTWAEAGIQTPRLSPRLSSPSKETLAWPENAAASPVFIANPRSRTPSILRHHSPDPWATEFSLANRSDAELPNSLKITSSVIPTIEAGQVEESSQADQLNIESGLEEDKNNGELPAEEGFASEGARPTGESSRSKTCHDLVDEHTETGSKLAPAVYDIPSRPSSACTIDSRDGPERQDSPITSIDEERGARMQNNSRKASGKVQELVGVYDGLARAASEEPPAPSRRETSRTASREKSSEHSEVDDDDEDYDDDGAGFGDFEDALANDDKATQSYDQAPPSLESPASKTELKGAASWELRDKEEKGHIAVAENASVEPQNMLNRFRHIRFDTHLASMDKLFSNLPDSVPDSSTEDWEISDHIINDSFTTISERKAWYRVSRYGSMRKHNSGDDENYHRVTWPTSQLHDDTIKIVRRWMEQDSYAGKATLGGTKRTGFFDWDSDAAPVGLDEVFQRRKPVAKHIRTTSIPANNVIKTTLAEQRPYRNSTGISLATELQSANQPVVPVPTFGWNSEAPKDTLPTTFSHITQSPYPTSVPVQGHRPAPIQTTSIEEDDDDWGEMISSPRAAEVRIDPSVSTLPFPTIPTENHGSTPQLLLPTSGAGQSEQPTLPVLQTTQPPPSDALLFSDISALDKTTQPPNRHPPKALSHGSISGCDTPSHNAVVSRTAVDEASAAAAAAPIPSNQSKSGSQDDIIVQKILQRLPDLSYMLR